MNKSQQKSTKTLNRAPTLLKLTNQNFKEEDYKDRDRDGEKERLNQREIY